MYEYTLNRDPLDLGVLFTPLTPKTRNQVNRNSCSSVLQSTPPSQVVWWEQCCHVTTTRWRINICHSRKCFFNLFIIAFPFKKKLNLLYYVWLFCVLIVFHSFSPIEEIASIFSEGFCFPFYCHSLDLFGVLKLFCVT